MINNEIYKIISYTKQKLELVHRKMTNIIARGVLKLISQASDGTWLLQGTFMENEVISDFQHPQEYGFASKPNEGAYIVALFNGGNRDHGQAFIVYDPQYVPTDLGSGDSCIFDSSGNRVWLKNSGGILIENGTNTITLNSSGISITDKNSNSIVMTSAGITVATSGTPVTFNAPVIFNDGWTLSGGTGAGSGSIAVTGQIADSVGSMAKMRGEYNAHTHSDPQGGTTGTPSDPMD